MSKRGYTKMEAIATEIQALRKLGKTRREIAEHFGLGVKQIECWITRYNRKQVALAQGIIPRTKGRPRKDGTSPQHNELERLRMENRLLRDFLQSTGRGCEPR